jgi:hypothetical protein
VSERAHPARNTWATSVRQPTNVASRVVLRLKPDRLVAHGGGIKVG